MKNFSRIDPITEITAGKDKLLTGIAFAAARGVQLVEVSLSGEITGNKQGAGTNGWSRSYPDGESGYHRLITQAKQAS